jgi:glycosyltransferase involved in cell wall biosynthesis
VITVGVDLAPLLGQRTGIGVAVEGMMRSLGSHPDLSLVAWGLTGTGWRRLAGALPGSRSARAPMPAGPLLRVWARTDHPNVEWWTGPIDVVHGTNFVVPPARRAARVVSVWDLSALRFPELSTPTARRYPQLVRRAIERGATVHTASHAMADEIVLHLRAEPERVRVCPLGVDLPAVSAPGPSTDGPPYILALGTAEPRKDLPGLVSAFDRLATRHPAVELHIVGPAGWGEAELTGAIARARHRARIRRLGWVADVSATLRGATVLAYPSRYEGFGLPPLEAMAQGVPVVATAAGAIPEVLGDAALLVPPGDPERLAEALDEVLRDPDERERLVSAGRARAARYPWSATGDALMALYRDLAS